MRAVDDPGSARQEGPAEAHQPAGDAGMDMDDVGPRRPGPGNRQVEDPAQGPG